MATIPYRYGYECIGRFIEHCNNIPIDQKLMQISGSAIRMFRHVLQLRILSKTTKVFYNPIQQTLVERDMSSDGWRLAWIKSPRIVTCHQVCQICAC